MTMHSHGYPLTTHDETLLENLRNQIDDIDEHIVELLVQRQNIVNEVVALKRSHNIPVYHPAREENLISKRREQGHSAGLNPNFVEEIYRTILRQSRVVQTRQMAHKCVRPGAVILIVGGQGSMGTYFRKWFSDSGYAVRILDKDDWSHAKQLCDGVDLAIISVPIDMTAHAIEKLSPYLPANAVLADITSIKQLPVKTMLNCHAGPVIGLHPMFGPSTSNLDKQIVVATPGRAPSECQWLLDQFAAWGSIIITSDPEEHDEMMNIVQALRHFATFAFGQFLFRKKVRVSRTLEFSSPIYRLELGMVGRLFAQDSSLYSEIILASPERRALLKEYIVSMNENLDMLDTGDKAIFQEEFRKITEWFGPFSEQAMRESTFLIDKLIERF